MYIHMLTVGYIVYICENNVSDWSPGKVNSFIIFSLQLLSACLPVDRKVSLLNLLTEKSYHCHCIIVEVMTQTFMTSILNCYQNSYSSLRLMP